MPDRPTVVTVLIPLPLFYNADEKGRREPVEDEKFVMTAEEIAMELQEGGTMHVFRDAKPLGFWWNEGIVERDVHALLEVDVPDTAAVRAWLKSYARDVLLKRFHQKAIYLKFVGPIERLVVTDEAVVGDETELKE
ncbi:MAG: hypothetical protein HYY17_15550 [Planctomycetes bacterium]|nr:hypothetical protein [Planctomycetota bacterium]